MLVGACPYHSSSSGAQQDLHHSHIFSSSSSWAVGPQAATGDQHLVIHCCPHVALGLLVQVLVLVAGGCLGSCRSSCHTTKPVLVLVVSVGAWWAAHSLQLLQPAVPPAPQAWGWQRQQPAGVVGCWRGTLLLQLLVALEV